LTVLSANIAEATLQDDDDDLDIVPQENSSLWDLDRNMGLAMTLEEPEETVEETRAQRDYRRDNSRGVSPASAMYFDGTTCSCRKLPAYLCEDGYEAGLPSGMSHLCSSTKQLYESRIPKHDPRHQWFAKRMNRTTPSCESRARSLQTGNSQSPSAMYMYTL
jgi:hypothetical protein